MGSTASGGRRGAHRVPARPFRSRPSRLRTAPARLVLVLVAAVAGTAVVTSPLSSWAGSSAVVLDAAVRVATGSATTTDTARAASAEGAAAAGPAAPAGTDAGAPLDDSGRQLHPSGRMDLRQPPPPTAPQPMTSSVVGDPRAGLAHGSVDPSDLVGSLRDPDIAGSLDVRFPDGLPGLAAAESPAVPSAEPEDLTGYVWPLRGARITTWFEDTDDGSIVMRGKRIHDGLDIASFCGHRVLAAHSGIVLYAGRAFSPYIGFDGPLDTFFTHLRAGGDWLSLPRVVVIDDRNGYRSAYVHLGSQAVKAGDVVTAGDTIGREGATGHASGCHLHYMLIRMDGPLVPVAPALVKKWYYPAFARERIDPIRVLSFKLKGAARRVPGVNPPKVPYRYVPPARHRPAAGGEADPQPWVEHPV